MPVPGVLVVEKRLPAGHEVVDGAPGDEEGVLVKDDCAVEVQRLGEGGLRHELHTPDRGRHLVDGAVRGGGGPVAAGDHQTPEGMVVEAFES